MSKKREDGKFTFEKTRTSRFEETIRSSGPRRSEAEGPLFGGQGLLTQEPEACVGARSRQSRGQRRRQGDHRGIRDPSGGESGTAASRAPREHLSAASRATIGDSEKGSPRQDKATGHTLGPRPGV